jgi:hypothetical protein
MDVKEAGRKGGLKAWARVSKAARAKIMTERNLKAWVTRRAKQK